MARLDRQPSAKCAKSHQCAGGDQSEARGLRNCGRGTQRFRHSEARRIGTFTAFLSVELKHVERDERMQLDHLAPHDLRRTCAKLRHVNGGELEQIQFLLGHASVLTTERYLGFKQNLEEPVNDRFGSVLQNGRFALRPVGDSSSPTGGQISGR